MHIITMYFALMSFMQKSELANSLLFCNNLTSFSHGSRRWSLVHKLDAPTFEETQTIVMLQITKKRVCNLTTIKQLDNSQVLDFIR